VQCIAKGIANHISHDHGAIPNRACGQVAVAIAGYLHMTVDWRQFDHAHCRRTDVNTQHRCFCSTPPATKKLHPRDLFILSISKRAADASKRFSTLQSKLAITLSITDGTRGATRACW